VQETEIGDAVGDGRAAGAPGVGPAVDALLEEEPVEDELTAPVEQLGQRPLPVGAVETVVMLDVHHRHALPGGRELVHRGSDGLLTPGQLRQSRVPLGLADDRRASDRHGFKFAAPGHGRGLPREPTGEPIDPGQARTDTYSVG
jgi:hypothetical protein